MLKATSVHAGYGSVPVLYDVSLNVQRGEAVGLIGANGAGKTTLVRTICGFLKPTQGRIDKDSLDLASVRAHDLPRQGIAAVLENRRLFGEMTVHENLILGARGGQKVSPDRPSFSLDDVYELFPVVKERLDARVSLLSGGQQQMVAVARALMLQPDILILDEPSTGLAPKIIQDMLSVFNTLRARGLSMLVVEQNVSIAAKLTSRGYVMSLGRVVAEVPQGGWDTFMRDSALVRAYLGGHAVSNA